MSIIAKSIAPVAPALALMQWLQSCPACRKEDALRKAGTDFPFNVLKCQGCGQVVLQLDDGEAEEAASGAPERQSRLRTALRMRVPSVTAKARSPL